jgi:5-methyltetrahydrofolate--homocysteine methyltransferase
MTEYTEWRGHDLAARIAKIRRAFDREPVSSADDIPILINTPAYFSFGSKDKPADYYTNPARMLEYQSKGYEEHLNRVRDDYVPYFMPWFGTGVLASAFGAEIRVPGDPSDDPAVLEPCIRTPADAARLRLPVPARDGWMPRVLETVDYAVAYGDLPVGLTDMQGPLDTLGQMCGQAQLYRWMYSEPRMIHNLMDLVTEAFIEWVKTQKEHIGEPLDSSNGLQGAYSPGCGVWESDDDLVLIDPGLYQEFVVPYVSRIFEVFGNGSVHFCGDGSHHLNNLRQIKNLTVVNNSPLGNFAAFTRLRNGLGGRAVIQIQDASPAEPEAYYPQLFAGIDDFSGLMLATFVMDNVGMDNQGGYVPVDWDPFDAANRIVTSVRQSVARRLAGDPTPVQAESYPKAVAKVKETGSTHSWEKRFSTAQVAALNAIREALLDFDQAGIKHNIQFALDVGLRPFDIILDGMAEGMSEVGSRYEMGEFFLPQLVMAGATMQEGMAYLGPLLKGGEGVGSLSRGKVILGTVKGDLHDIGKNLVGMMLEGARFEVIDLGVDVSPEKFIDAVKQHGAKLVGMSALLTTTMTSMKRAMEAFEMAGLRDQVKIMIGGAPLSQEFADQIGADGYASTAIGAVNEAERLLGLAAAGL